MDSNFLKTVWHIMDKFLKKKILPPKNFFAPPKKFPQNFFPISSGLEQKKFREKIPINNEVIAEKRFAPLTFEVLGGR